jgi:hypothetical protein
VDPYYNTYPFELVYVESGDPLWGDGAGVGMNELGKSLMRVRERIRAELGMRVICFRCIVLSQAS